MENSIEIFCCYARKDQSLLLALKAHLLLLQRQGLITIWADTDIDAGMEWESELHKHLNTAQIILLLVSPDFMASDYCYGKEMMRAMERHMAQQACVIPIILRAVLWISAPFGKLQALPTNAQPVISSSWHSPDDAFLDIAEGIQKVVEKLREAFISTGNTSKLLKAGPRFEEGQNRMADNFETSTSEREHKELFDLSKHSDSLERFYGSPPE